MKRFKVNKSDYPREAVVFCLQRYLEPFWVTISEDAGQYIIRLERKSASLRYPSEKEFMNALLESEFTSSRVRETLPLREKILSAALSPYTGEKGSLE